MIGYILFFSLISLAIGAWIGMMIFGYVLKTHPDIVDQLYVKYGSGKASTTPPHNP